MSAQGRTRLRGRVPGGVHRRMSVEGSAATAEEEVLRSGRGGHDLRGLWTAAGFPDRDLHGHSRAFIEFWNTAIRYDACLPSTVNAEGWLAGAMKLAGYIAKRAKHVPQVKR